MELEDDFFKNHGIFFELENNSYFRLMFETKHRHIEFINQIGIGTRLYNLEDKKIYTVIFNTIDSEPESCSINLGMIKYEPENIGMPEDRGEQLFEELKRKGVTQEQFADKDKIDLILYPLMDKSEFILERLLKIRDLVKNIKDNEQRIVFIGAVAGVAEQYISKTEMQRFKEGLMMTEIGYLVRQEGIKEGIRESIFTILVNKFESIPECIYVKINEESDERTLRGWLYKAMSCISVKDLGFN